MKYLLIILMLLASGSFADSINFGFATHHNDINVCGFECNENNNLIAIEYNDWVAASFVNSYYKQTYLVAKNIKLTENIGVLAGLSHGYDQDCFNPSKSTCSEDGVFDRELNVFTSLLIQHEINNVQIKWIESFFYRSLLVGFKF